jgi:membrane carboxypeptidase/penicillin-binding protein
VNHGTGVGLRARGFRGPVAGKTGSTNDLRDSWFVAYTPQIVVVVWVGVDDGASTGLPGSEGALPIAADFLIRGLGSAGGEDFPVPDGVDFAQVNAETGLRAGYGCPGEREIFLAGTEPRGVCDRFVEEPPLGHPREREWTPLPDAPSTASVDPRPVPERRETALERALSAIKDALRVRR